MSATVVSSSTVIPSMTTVPALCGCRRLSVLMKVDLPEPDGPRMTMISPFFTLMSIPFNAQKSPKFTFTPLVSIIISLSPVPGLSSLSYSLMLLLLLLL